MYITHKQKLEAALKAIDLWALNQNRDPFRPYSKEQKLEAYRLQTAELELVEEGHDPYNRSSR